MGKSKGKVITLAIVFIILPMVAVVLRFWAKAMKRAVLILDNYMIIFALVSLIILGNDIESYGS